jgi:hypothetical protein
MNRVLNSRYRKQQIGMLHSGRCGSSVLGNMLNAHSKFVWAGEIFEEHMGFNAQTASETNGLVTKTISSSRDSSCSMIYGFATKYLSQQHLSSECLNIGIVDYVTLLDEMGFSHFIVLNRNNYLRRALSALVGKATGKWHSHDEIRMPTNVTVDIDSYLSGSESKSLLEFFASSDQRRNQLTRALSNRNALLLTYEDDVQDDPLIGYRKICNFLGIVDEAPTINLRRTNPFNCEQIIANYAEVQAALDGTKYSWMLDDKADLTK